MKAANNNNRLLLIVLSVVVVIFASVSPTSSALQIGETCSNDKDCSGSGLQCQTCPLNGNTRPRCTRTQPAIPTSKVKGLPFNKYSWLTTHNSFAISGSKSLTGSIILAPTNQDRTVTSQLKDGARGLMLDMYDFKNDIWLCHSFQGKCYDYTAFQPASNVLKEIRSFLESNPKEIITIFIEDYVTSKNGLTKAFASSGLNKFMFPLSRMPKNGEDWPTVDDMVGKNQRLVVFTSMRSKEASEGIAYQWNYVVENQYGDEGMVTGECSKRSESKAMNTTSAASLVLMNYFRSSANSTEACADNSSPLINMMRTCNQDDGKRWPNFIAVDFYEKSDGGGAAEVVDEANGQLTCNCSSIAYCQVKGNTTTCNAPRLAPPPPAAISESTSPHTDSSSGSTGDFRTSYQNLYIVFATALLLSLV